MRTRTALVTGASGHVGSHLVPALLVGGFQVRVLARNPSKLDPAWRDHIDVVTGDAEDIDDVRRALDGIDVAYYLLHSMDGRGDFRERDRRLAQVFAQAAHDTGVARIVYLSGLHPEGHLSPHLASRVEVGEILLGSGVPTAVLQAGILLGRGSASFEMLRHLSERLPLAFGPVWLNNRIQAIAVRDAIFYLIQAADLPVNINRTIDIGMEEVLTYRDMMRRYAKVTGLRRRRIGTVPVLTPNLASYWVGWVTPVSAGIARPLVGSLIHEAVKHENDAAELLGCPPGGLTGFDDAIRAATSDLDPQRWSRILTRTGLQVGASALAGALLLNRGQWRRIPLRNPAAVIPALLGTVLFVATWLHSSAAIARREEEGRRPAGLGVRRGVLASFAINSAWRIWRARQDSNLQPSDP